MVRCFLVIKASKAILLKAMFVFLFLSLCFAKAYPAVHLTSETEVNMPYTASALQKEVEKLALSLPEILPNELRIFLPVGAKGTSREDCLVLLCDTIIKENNVMPSIFEFLLQKIQMDYELLNMERVKQDGHTYWVVSISTQKSDIIPSERVTIWMDVTHSNQNYSIKERDEALQRASQLDEKITAIFDRINDYESAEAAVKELKPLVDRFEKEMHIVILGTPEGDQWELSIDDPKRSIIWDKLVNAHFFDSPNLYKVYAQICSCYITNSI